MCCQCHQFLSRVKDQMLPKSNYLWGSPYTVLPNRTNFWWAVFEFLRGQTDTPRDTRTDRTQTVLCFAGTEGNYRSLKQHITSDKATAKQHNHITTPCIYYSMQRTLLQVQCAVHTYSACSYTSSAHKMTSICYCLLHSWHLSCSTAVTAAAASNMSVHLPEADQYTCRTL